MGEDVIEIDFFRGVEEVINEESLSKKLTSGKKLRIKLGVDPTRPDIHLGHVVVLKKLKKFQDMGHQAIFLIGDFTTKIGDPSGKSKTRPMLTDEDIDRNTRTYLDQVGRILDVSKTEVRKNSEWFSGMNFSDILQIAAKFTVAQILERDDFEKRLKSGSDIGIHETLYPIMQAFDSVMLKADVELGGTDQKFNMLAGRSLQRKMGQEPQDVITTKLLVGLDGKEKMSKSLDNYIGVTESPDQQFGKIMSIPDELIIPYLNLVTDVPKEEIANIESAMKDGANPKEFKERLGREIVTMFHSGSEAVRAEENFKRVFRGKEQPDEMTTINLPAGSHRVVDLLARTGVSGSFSQSRRLIEQGGVSIDSAKISDPLAMISVYDGMVVRVGKYNFFQVKTEND